VAGPCVTAMMSRRRLRRRRLRRPLLCRTCAGRPEDEVTVSVQRQFRGRGNKAKEDRDRHGEHCQAHGAELPGPSRWLLGRCRRLGRLGHRFGWPHLEPCRRHRRRDCRAPRVFCDVGSHPAQLGSDFRQGRLQFGCLACRGGLCRRLVPYLRGPMVSVRQSQVRPPDRPLAATGAPRPFPVIGRGFGHSDLESADVEVCLRRGSQCPGRPGCSPLYGPPRWLRGRERITLGGREALPGDRRRHPIGVPCRD